MRTWAGRSLTRTAAPAELASLLLQWLGSDVAARQRATAALWNVQQAWIAQTYGAESNPPAVAGFRDTLVSAVEAVVTPAVVGDRASELRATESSIRGVAALVLGALDDLEALSPLFAALRGEQDPDVYATLAFGLARHRDPDVLRTLAERCAPRYRALQENKYKPSRHNPRGPGALGAVDANAAFEVLHETGTPAGFDALLHVLGFDPRLYSPDGTEQVKCFVEAHGIEPVWHAHEHPYSGVRSAILRSLAEVRRPIPALGERLRVFLHDASHGIQSDAVRALLAKRLPEGVRDAEEVVLNKLRSGRGEGSASAFSEYIAVCGDQASLPVLREALGIVRGVTPVTLSEDATESLPVGFDRVEFNRISRSSTARLQSAVQAHLEELESRLASAKAVG